MKVLFPDLFSGIDVSVFKCEVCTLAKHHKVSYPISNFKSTIPLSVIHSDVWGPSRIANLGGTKWFVTFIDECTRVTWVYLMKEKSDVYQVFVKFYNWIFTQFGTKIQVLRTDQGGEYIGDNLATFFFEKGLSHQKNCSGTPQQNGLAERKNRHLVEVARALLFTKNVPKHYWGDSVLTAAYLINRMPSRVLKHQTPIHVLSQAFPSSKMFSHLPPKIFGSVVYVHIQSPKTLGVNLIQEPLGAFFLGIHTAKRDINVTIRQLKEPLSQWMLFFMKICHITPRMIFRGRLEVKITLGIRQPFQHKLGLLDRFKR